MEEEDRKRETHRLRESVESLIDEAVSSGQEALKTHAGGTLKGLRDTVRGAVTSRKNVVMVRLDENSLSSVDELVDAGLATSRSESAAYLIAEGIKAKSSLFERIAATTEEIRKAREELQKLVAEDLNDES